MSHFPASSAARCGHMATFLPLHYKGSALEQLPGLILGKSWCLAFALFPFPASRYLEHGPAGALLSVSSKGPRRRQAWDLGMCEGRGRPGCACHRPGDTVRTDCGVSGSPVQGQRVVLRGGNPRVGRGEGSWAASIDPGERMQALALVRFTGRAGLSMPHTGEDRAPL